MLRRYLQLLELLYQPDCPRAIKSLLLYGNEERCVQNLAQALHEVEDATTFLQRDDTTLVDAHASFSHLHSFIMNSEILDGYITDEWLEYVLRKFSLDSTDVSDPLFQSGVVKVINGSQRHISSNEITRIKVLRTYTVVWDGRVLETGPQNNELVEAINSFSRQYSLRLQSFTIEWKESGYCEWEWNNPTPKEGFYSFSALLNPQSICANPYVCDRRVDYKDKKASMRNIPKYQSSTRSNVAWKIRVGWSWTTKTQETLPGPSEEPHDTMSHCYLWKLEKKCCTITAQSKPCKWRCAYCL